MIVSTLGLQQQIYCVPDRYAYVNYRVSQKSKPAYFCKNFVYCQQPIFIMFGSWHIYFCNRRIYSDLRRFV